LDLRENKNSDAATDKGMAMAEKIANQTELTLEELKDMYAYFSRHEVDKEADNFGDDENPSNGYVSWLLWGGDSGYDWSRRKRETLKNNDNYSKE
jgi:hypothetical protein